MEASEKPSRQRIINHLKRAGPASVSWLSREVGISPMAVRQHLHALERQGIVHSDVRKTGVGRPVSLYWLTERAENIFPKSYGRFISEVLKTVERLDGKGKVDDIFRARKEETLKARQEVLAGLGPLDRARTFAEMLNQDGYMAELGEAEGGYSLRQFNCPISEVAAKHRAACKYELELYRDLLGAGVRRSECIGEGDASCTYLIPGLK